MKESGLHPASKVVALKDFKQENDKVRSTHLRNNSSDVFVSTAGSNIKTEHKQLF